MSREGGKKEHTFAESSLLQWCINSLVSLLFPCQLFLGFKTLLASTIIRESPINASCLDVSNKKKKQTYCTYLLNFL